MKLLQTPQQLPLILQLPHTQYRAYIADILSGKDSTKQKQATANKELQNTTYSATHHKTIMPTDINYGKTLPKSDVFRRRLETIIATTTTYRATEKLRSHATDSATYRSDDELHNDNDVIVNDFIKYSKEREDNLKKRGYLFLF
jgi:hypothetical protein